MSQWAMIFPGQGSQSIGMLSDIYNQYPVVSDVFNTASEQLGYDLWSLISHGPLEQLNQTVYTQPALFVAEYALWQCWCAQTDLRPNWMAGHSLGEYSALACAGVFSFQDGLDLVVTRANAMQAAVPEGIGSMAAVIGLTDDQVVDICHRCAEGEVLSPANWNTIGQVVLAGHHAAVERAIQAALDSGAKIAKKIPVSVPSHCSLMQPAVEVLMDTFNGITWNQPAIPVIQNTDAAVHAEVDAIRHSLLQQLTGSVHWFKTVQFLQDQGVSHLVECGPGKVLAGLAKRIDRQLITLPFNASDHLSGIKQQLVEVNA